MKRPIPQAAALRNRQTLTHMASDTDGHTDPAAPLPENRLDRKASATGSCASMRRS